jgi:hypothetical protein
VLTRGPSESRASTCSTLAESTDRTLGEATPSVAPAPRSLINRLRAMDDPPDEIGVEFGVQLNAKTGASPPQSRRRQTSES